MGTVTDDRPGDGPAARDATTSATAAATTPSAANPASASAAVASGKRKEREEAAGDGADGDEQRENRGTGGAAEEAAGRTGGEPAEAEAAVAEDLGPVVGPVIPKAKKKKKPLVFERVYLDALPSAEMYEKSYMHRDWVTHVAVSDADFFITGSRDGHLKFWKKKAVGVEFAKHFRAHLGPVEGLAVSADDTLCSTISSQDKAAKIFDAAAFDMISMLKLPFTPSLTISSQDKAAKIFDVATFDMISMLKLPFEPSAVCFLFKPDNAIAKLAIADKNSPEIHVFDARGGTNEAVGRVKVHGAPVVAMQFNVAANAVVSTDASGMIEYWSADTYTFPAASVRFKYKTDTDLYALAKAKTTAPSLEISPEGCQFATVSPDRRIRIAPDGSQFATVSPDRRIRVFWFATGKLRRTYDESLEAAQGLQRGDVPLYRLDAIDFWRRLAAAQELQRGDVPLYRLDAIDFGRRLAVEREMERERESNDDVPSANAVFDETGNFIIYPTLLGIKVVNLHENKVARILGKVESNERFLRIALYQGGKAARRIRKMATIANSQDAKGGPSVDPSVIACAFKKHRFYLFSQREPEEGEEPSQGRDVFNEKPPPEEMLALADVARTGSSALPDSVVMHTTMGDIHLKLYPEECPRTVENFTTHCSNGYYEGLLFHRVIKGFMVQTGCPLGDGTGGQSIWGGEFADEFHKSLRHDRPFTLSMANAGPNTNGSQFFITTVATPWLDNKHTVFGRVVKGMDVVQLIEKAKVDRNDKPYEDIKILNVTVPK
ncbi:unnamed protein product [Closterium sp. NIES-64]|nr:unnamed protein product [Closterium sp. NIES-64]